MIRSTRGIKRPSYGLFGGSFDPVQKGHIALARAALKERGLKRVYLVPAGRSPFKGEGPLASIENRTRLIRAAIRGLPGLSVALWERNRTGPSYTYQTVRFLRRRFPHRDWELILGQDAWASLRRWRRWRELVNHCTLVVGRRTAGAKRGGPRAYFVQAKLPAVSSTTVRDALSRGQSVRRWVPPAVAKEIKKIGLYPRFPTGLSAERLRHSLAVAAWAEKLARRHGADPLRAQRAGLYHDLAREWSPARLLSYVKRHRLKETGLSQTLQTKHPSLLHGAVSAHLALRRGWVTDRESCNAMQRHTTGHPRMGRLDKIIFVADFSSPDRPWPQSARVRRTAWRDLDRAFEMAVFYKTKDVLSRGATPLAHMTRFLNGLAHQRPMSLGESPPPRPSSPHGIHPRQSRDPQGKNP